MNGKNAIKTPDDGFRFMAVAIFRQAIKDLRGRDPVMALDAFCWLIFGDAEDFLEMIGYQKDWNSILRIVGGS